jgi:hypothetical protein
MKPKATELPKDSFLWKKVGADDFLDCFVVQADCPPRKAAQIITTFPGWGKFLLWIRRIVTTPFGLSNDGPDAVDKVGVFPVELETEEELIAGFDDKHLDFRVSVISRDGNVYLATWVHRHNLGGRIYLAVIMPFHVMIARNGLARVRQAVT